jgi:hypothetical protein
MKKNTYILNTLLALVVFAALLIAGIVRTVSPAVIIPVWNIPNLVLISLLTLLLDHYISPNTKRCYICIPVFAAITFSLLTWVSGFIAGTDVWKIALVGGIVFTATTWLFTSIQDRLSSGPAAKAAPILSAFALYLAVQGFMNIFL